MMGFIVSTSAVLLTAWIVHVVSYRLGRSEGIIVGQVIGRASVLYPHSVPDRFKVVPAGTNCGGPVGCDEDCPESQLPRPRISIPMPPVRCYGCDCDGSAGRIAVCRDDEIYGRNG